MNQSYKEFNTLLAMMLKFLQVVFVGGSTFAIGYASWFVSDYSLIGAIALGVLAVVNLVILVGVGETDDDDED